MFIHFWIEKAAIDLTISRSRKRDVGAPEKLIDGRMVTAYLHNPNVSAFASKKWSSRLLLFRSKNGCTCPHESPFREGSARGDWPLRHSTPLSTHRRFKNAADCQF